MERLTERLKNGQAAVIGCGSNCKYDFKYCNNQREDCPTINNIFEKLAKYEELEDDGKLLKLPCAVGDTVYVLAECGNIPNQLDGTFYGANGEPGSATGYYCPYENNCPFNDEDFEDCDKYKNRTAIFEDTVCFISCDESGVCVSTDKCAVHSPIGLSVFLTIEEAVSAFRKLCETAEYVKLLNSCSLEKRKEVNDNENNS